MKTKKLKFKKFCECKNCESKNTIKWGLRKTQNRGKVQRYKCKDCENTFVEDNGFYRMRNHPKKITLCLDLFYKGVSTREIQQHLQAFYPKNASWVSVYKWIVKYSKKISQFTDNLKLKVGEELQIDEMEIGKMKSKNRGWFIDSIDTRTRFMVASDFVKSRGMPELKNVLKIAKQKTEKQFKIITTDGYMGYPRAVIFAFGHSNFQRKEIRHQVVNALQGEGFNITIERLHNSIRHRIKTFRGFHGSIESANSIMKGYEIYYNFIRKHQSLKGKTPSELATEINFKTPNRWIELIELSK